MKRLNVRCCCQPIKILGTLPWDGVSSLFRFKKSGGGSIELPVAEYLQYREPLLGADLALLDPGIRDKLVEAIAVSTLEERAYKSEGMTVEQLTQIPEFVAGGRV